MHAALTALHVRAPVMRDSRYAPRGENNPFNARA